MVSVETPISGRVLSNHGGQALEVGIPQPFPGSVMLSVQSDLGESQPLCAALSLWR